MSEQSWVELVITALALAVMAVAATVEATATLVSRHRLRQLADERGRPRSVQGLLDPRRTLVASLLLVQAVAIATAASLLTTTALRELRTGEHVLAVVLVGVVFLLLGQALPRAMAATRPERAARAGTAGCASRQRLPGPGRACWSSGGSATASGRAGSPTP